MVYKKIHMYLASTTTQLKIGQWWWQQATWIATKIKVQLHYTTGLLSLGPKHLKIPCGPCGILNESAMDWFHVHQNENVIISIQFLSLAALGVMKISSKWHFHLRVIRKSVMHFHIGTLQNLLGTFENLHGQGPGSQQNCPPRNINNLTGLLTHVYIIKHVTWWQTYSIKFQDAGSMPLVCTLYASFLVWIGISINWFAIWSRHYPGNSPNPGN